MTLFSPISSFTRNTNGPRRGHVQLPPHTKPGGTYFFTVNLRDRSSDLLVCEIRLLRQTVGEGAPPFHIDAWVAPPEYMHCLWPLPPSDHAFAEH